MLITSRLHKRSIDIAPRALCISIYSGMTEKITAVSEELGVPVDVFEGGIFNDGHLFAQEVQEQYDVIISQAGGHIHTAAGACATCYGEYYGSGFYQCL